MEKDEISILQALRDTLKQRDDFSVSLIDDNIKLQIHHVRFLKEIITQRKLLEAALESLRNTPFRHTDAGTDLYRTLVLINNGIKCLTGEEDPAKRK